MRELNLQEIHKATLNLMDRIHNICEENDIKYYIIFGTLIGAIRHNGFIPWDDDFDICMTRDDFNKFCDITGKETGRYKLASRRTTKNYYFGIPRYYDSNYEYLSELKGKKYDLGIFIDIYPFDACADTFDETKSVHKNVKKIDSDFSIYINKFSYTNRWRSIFKVPYHYYLRLKYGNRFPQVVDKMIETEIYSHFNDNSKYIAPYWETKDFRMYERAWLKERELHKFEDREYWIPKEYDQLLTLLYGNYMQMPSEKERMSTHKYKILEKRTT